MPGTISFDGIATGMDTTNIVDKLIDVESRPKILKEAEKIRYENQLEAWRQINTKLLDIKDQSRELWNNSTWDTLKVDSSDEEIMTASGRSDAQAGSYTFTVEQLALNHQVASTGFSSANSDISAGDFTITTDTQSVTITVDSTNNTLQGIANSINDEDMGVTASVIYDGADYRLIVSADETGADNEITLSGDAGGPLDDLTFSDIQTAQDAQINFGSGAGALTVTSASNDVEDLVEGVTLHLHTAESGQEVTLTLGRDSSALEEKMQSYLDSFNDFMEYANDLSKFDTETFEKGILQTDSQLKNIVSAMRSAMINPVDTNGTYTSLKSIGIEFQEDGTFDFDTDKFRTAIDTDYASVRALFQTTGYSDDSKVDFVYAGNKTEAPSYTGYEVEITQAASKAEITGGTTIQYTGTDDLDIVEGSNDTITLKVDGGSELTVTLTAGTYTASELAKHIQTSINAEAGSGSVKVTEDADTLTISSTTWGDASELELTGGNALTDLGFTTGDSDTGTTLKGTINGESAYGSGQILIGASDNDTTAGLQIKVTFDADDVAAGGTANVYFDKGVGARVNEYLRELTNPITGMVDRRETFLQGEVDRIQERVEEMEERLEQKRESLLNQFYRMESSVNGFNTQGNYLLSQLSGLNRNWA